jgi:hypothetical protein
VGRPDGSFAAVVRRVVLALVMATCAVPAAAQSATPPPAAPGVQFLPRFEFHLGGEHLTSDDKRFVWDTNFGGEVDLLDYGAGRAMFVANYQAILGEEFRRFDPTQGNYILEGSMSARALGYEVAGVFYHQSRHLADRPKRNAVDWNMLGGRVRGDWIVGAIRISARADLRGVLGKSFVDYRWEFDGGARSDIPLRPGIGLLLTGRMQRFGVDGSRNRGDQTGFRGEGGVRLEGRAAAMEIFLAAERRVDPYPLELSTATWMTAGFRLLSR